MEDALDGKVAIVTAASRGLGRASAEALAARGAKVLAVARGESELATLAAAWPGRCVACVGDLHAPDLPQRVVDQALQSFGRLDILVANTAGPPSMQPLEARESDFAAAFDTVF